MAASLLTSRVVSDAASTQTATHALGARNDDDIGYAAASNSERVACMDTAATDFIGTRTKGGT